MSSIPRQSILPLNRRRAAGNHPVFKALQRIQGETGTALRVWPEGPA